MPVSIASSTRTYMDRWVPGNVTPRRASRFFLPRETPPSPPSPPSPMRKRDRDAPRATIPLALQKRRCMYRPSSAYLSAFQSGEDACYLIASEREAHGIVNPLSLAFRQQYLAVGDDEGCLSLLDTQQPCPTAVAYSSEPLVHGSVFALEWHDALLAVGGSDCTVRLWDAEKQAVTITWEGHVGSPRALAWSPEGCVTSGARDGDVYVWDARTPSAALHIPRAHAKKKSVAAVTALAYLPGGQTLTTASSANAVVHVWDMRMTKRPMAKSDDASRRASWNTRSHGISSLVVAASRHTMYAACTDGCVYAWDASDVTRPAVPGEASALYEVVQRQNSLYARLALYDDTYLALGCHMGHVVLWDVSTRIRPDVDCHGFVHGGTVLPRMHNAEINDVSWTCGPRGPCLASACDDLTTRLWT